MEEFTRDANHHWNRFIGATECFLLWELSLHPSSVAILRGEREFPDVLINQLQHRGLVTFYQYLHSLFDPSGIDFRSFRSLYSEHIEGADVSLFADLAVSAYESIETDIMKVRHNIGAHYGRAEKSVRAGYAAFGNLSVEVGDLIMGCLRIVYRGLRSLTKMSASARPPEEGSDAALKESVLVALKNLNSAAGIEDGKLQGCLRTAEQVVYKYMLEKFYTKGVHPIVQKVGGELAFTIIRTEGEGTD